MLFVASACSTLVVLALGIASSAAGLKLENVIIFSRHGIRAPFDLPAGIQNYSQDNRPWHQNLADWGVDHEAQLTPHGAKVMAHFGAFQKSMLQEMGVSSCADLQKSSTVYSDIDDRDWDSSVAFFDGLSPNCQMTIYNDKSYMQKLFNQGGYEVGGSCTMPDRADVDGTIGNNATRWSELYYDLISELGRSINCCQPVVCGPKAKKCDLTEVPTAWIGEFWAPYDGPLYRAFLLLEYLQLMYLQGLDISPTTSLTPARLIHLIDLHQRFQDRVESLAVAKASGSQLMAHIVDTIDQLTTGGKHPDLKSKPTDKLIFYAGHDLNIEFLARLLDLEWLTSSSNEREILPTGHLQFRIYSDASQYFVKIFFSTPTYKQQRYAEILNATNPPDRVYVSIPWCSHGPEGSCPVEHFKKIAMSRIEAACVKPLS